MKPGDRIGRYELIELIGEGAMAHVFAARHPVLERRVALKILKSEVCHDGHFVARFLDDARSASGLDHPNVVRVLDVDGADGQPFIVMELVDGLPLDRWLANRQVEVSEAVRVARDVARALTASHAAGLVHRDVKPSNILIDRKTGIAKLTDFGAAKRERPAGQQLTEIGQRIGTPRYMAPEQIDGSTVDARTDLFALGATLYELLAGGPAFEGTTVSAVFHGILFGEPRPLAERRPDTAPELVELVAQLLAKAPNDRPRTAEEVVAALDAVSSGAGTTPRPNSFPDTPSRPRMADPAERGGDEATPSTGGVMVRSRLMLAVAGAVVLVVVGLGAWWFLAPAPEQDQALKPAPPMVTAEPSDQESQPPAAETEAPAAAQGQGEGASGKQSAAAPEEETAPTEAAEQAEPPPEQAAAPEPPSTADEAETSAAQPAPGTETTGSGIDQPPEQPVITQVPTEATPTEEETETAALGAPDAPEAAPAIWAQPLDCPSESEAPGCALAAQALRTLGAPAAAAPELTLNQPDGIYLDQDYLVVEAAMPPELGGYLYLDVLTDAGQVFHLLPEPMREDNVLPAGSEIRVGVEEAERAAGVRHWQVEAPFSEGYLLATVSEKRLYEGLRPIEETITDYREVLLQSLADPGTGRKAARVERLEFRPRS